MLTFYDSIIPSKSTAVIFDTTRYKAQNTNGKGGSKANMTMPLSTGKHPIRWKMFEGNMEDKKVI